MKHYTFTSESVTEGHPDKVADLISDTIADYIIDNNQSHRAAIETLVTTNKVCVSGEYKSSKNISNKVRISIQVRFNFLDNKLYNFNNYRITTPKFVSRHQEGDDFEKNRFFKF